MFLFTHLSSTSAENIASEASSHIQMIAEHVEGEMWYYESINTLFFWGLF